MKERKIVEIKQNKILTQENLKLQKQVEKK